MSRISFRGSVDYSRLEETSFRRSRVRNLCAVVVGAGALGNEVVKTLGLLGTGSIIVIDPDVVEATNLTRSILFRGNATVGRNKALALAAAVQNFFPDTMSIGIPEEVADVGFQRIKGADIIFGCVDSDLARLEIAYIGTKLDIPVADAGLGTHDYSHGRVSYFPGRRATCYCCLLTEQKRRELLTLWESQARPCWIETASADGDSFPGTPMIAAIVGAMQVELGLRWFFATHKDSAAEGISVEISLDPRPCLETLKLPLSKSCPFHLTEGVLVPTPRSEAKTTVGKLLDAATGGSGGHAAVILDWPICTRARCSACGRTWSPMRRLAAFRRSGCCPGCGSREILVEDSIYNVASDSRWATATLAELGVPARHLHSVRLEYGGDA